MLKKSVLLILALGIAAIGINACSDDDNPVVPPTHNFDFEVVNTFGGALILKGDFLDAAGVQMTQDTGSIWKANVQNIPAGSHTWDVWWDDGSKAEVKVADGAPFTVLNDGTLSGETPLTPAVTEPPGGTDIVFTVVNNNPEYVNIKVKGGMTPGPWETVDMVQDGDVWTWTWTQDLVAEGDYEWGVIEDDGSEWGIWLLPGDNLAFTVDAAGAATGDFMLVVEAPQAMVDLTLNVDMNGVAEISGLGIHVAGSFNDWTPNATEMFDEDEDGVYTVVVHAEQNSTAEFKFINGNAWGEGIQESVPSECGVDDGFGAFNRYIDVGTEPATYSAPFSGCPGG